MQSNHLLAGLGALALFGGTASADIVITEIVDGPLTGGLPKWVEITNTGSTAVDMSGYSIGNFNNGSTTLGGSISKQLLMVTLAPGDSYVVNYDSGDAPGMSIFFDVYGVDPSDTDLGAFINGNDAVALFLTDGTGPNGEATGDGTDATMVDVYGQVGEDPAGMGTWGYTDGYSQRCNDAANGGVWDPSNWNIAGEDSLEAGCAGDDTCETMNLQTLTFPFSFPDCGAMEPGTAACFGDGTAGTDCPCGNPGASGEGCANSTGAGAILSASGTASLSNDSLVLSAAQTTNQPGVFFQGDVALNPPLLFGDGLRCCGQNVIRIGTYSPSGNATDTATGNQIGGIGPPIGAHPGNAGLQAGDSRCYQWWYRDPAGPCGGSFNLSNAYSLSWGA